MKNKVIGAFEKVSFPDLGLVNVVAKIDTGATSGSVHATHIKEVVLPNGKTALSFRPYGHQPSIIVKKFGQKEVKSSNGSVEARYYTMVNIVIQGQVYKIQITLADRSAMKKGVLIGRRFLRNHGFIVDPKKGTRYRGEVKS